MCGGMFNKTCLACDQEFTTHKPKATRCQTCIDNGVRAKKPKAHRRAAEKPTHERLCFGCGEVFQTHLKRAARCPSCIEADNPIKRSHCLSCDEAYFTPTGGNGFCNGCHAYHVSDIEDLEKQLEEEIKQRKRERRMRRVEHQQTYLDLISKAPERKLTMTSQTMNLPANLLWKELCWNEGSTTVLLREAGNLTDTDKEKMLLLFYRFRCKGFRTQQLCNLDAARILKLTEEEITEAIDSLPMVEEEDEPVEQFDPLEDLSPEARADLEAFLIARERAENAQRLGIAI